uniref:Putative trypsin n=1 Tax=Haematobia irritans TaxID=7368 RepID=A0A1L8E951_HAEIR
MNSFKILAIAMMMALMPAFMQCDQPTYQVSLYVKMHPKVPPIHLCNGVIIQSRLILTTASCIHYQFSATSSVVSLPPTSLSVIAGSSTAFADELILDVKDVLVAHHFNYTTGENDLALLRLNGKLPLDIRNDMSWITLEDASIFEGPCVANYYVRSSIPNGPNYIQTEELPLLEKEMCRANYDYPNSRKNDICSLYMLPFGFDCHSVDALLSHNGDRGTGLVCDNRLVGLLSMILPPEEDNSELGCSDKPINAFYTNLAPYLGWIYDKVSDEDISMYDDGEFVISVPYSGTNEDSMVSS